MMNKVLVKSAFTIGLLTLLLSVPAFGASVNKSIKIAAGAESNGESSVNGSITAVFEELGAGQRVNADTVNGKITIYLPAEASARVVAETVNGSIDGDDFGLKAEKGFVGRDLSGEIGAGEARISLDTVNGSIRIERD